MHITTAVLRAARAAGGSWRRWVLGAVVAFCALRLQLIGLVALVLWAVLPLIMHSAGFRWAALPAAAGPWSCQHLARRAPALVQPGMHAAVVCTG